MLNEPDQTSVVGVIGLGNMGMAMAETLGRAGFQVIGTDISQTARDTFSARGMQSADTIAALAEEAQIIVLSLPSSHEVNAVLEGEAGLLHQTNKPRLIIDTSTSEPDHTRRLAALARQNGHALVDAPVSGGPTGAASGSLSIMIGGHSDALAQAEPILQTLGDKLAYMGDVGSGHVTKILNNFLVASNLAVVGEVLRLGRRLGLEPTDLVSAVNNGTGRSAVSDIFMEKWVLPRSFESGFTMKLMRKDVNLAGGLTGDAHRDFPVSSAIVERWRQSAQELGDGEDFTRMADPFLYDGVKEGV